MLLREEILGEERGCLDQPIKCDLQLCILATGYRGQEPVREFPSDRRPNLRNLPSWGEPIQASQQRSLETRWNCKRGRHPIEEVTVTFFVKNSALQDGPCELLDI